MEYHSVMRCTCIHVTVILLPLYAVMRLLKTFGKHFPSCQRALFSIAVWERTVMPPRLQTTKFFRKIKSPRTIRKDWVNLRASTGLKELKSDPVVKQNVFVFTLPINPSPSWLSGTLLFSPKYIIFLITSSRFTLPDWVLLSFNCLGTLRRQVQPHNPAPRLIPAPHVHAYQAAKFYCRPASGHAGQAGK